MGETMLPPLIGSSCVILCLLCQFAAAQIVVDLCSDAVNNQPDANDERGVGTQAVCILEPTANAELGELLFGHFLFVKVAGSGNDGTDDFLCVEYQIGNISDGHHGFHVHTYGSLHSTDAQATDNHFQGDCNGCRPDAPLDLQSEAGLLNDGIPLLATGNEAAGAFDDTILTLSGTNSIIGRSVVVHATNNGTARIAQCVIGYNTGTDHAAYDFDSVNNVGGVTRAIAKLTTSGHADSSSLEETGFVRFTQRASGDGLLVEMWVTGFEDCDAAHEFHVHQLANIRDDDTTGPHFTGDIGDITGGRPNLGWLGPNNDTNPGLQSNRVTGEVHCSGSWVFRDPFAKLEGPNSIVGRSIVLHDSVDNADRISHGVIGILEEGAPIEAADNTTPEETPKVLVARAVLLPTRAEVEGEESQVRGTVEFSAEDGSNNILVNFHFTGLTREGGHGWHVHQWGDVSSDSAAATGGHFVGTCNDTATPCRIGTGVLPEIGLIGDGHSLVPLNGEAYGTIVDDTLRLNGIDSIVGRSVVVHGLGADDGIRVAQGVIGRVLDSEEMVQNQQPISSLRCDVTPLANDDGYNAAGYIRLSRAEIGGNITVDYNISGLDVGFHTWHVHVYGDLLGNQDGVSTTGHFIGTPDPVRPFGLNEVGSIDNGNTITANTDGDATGSFIDNYLQFHDGNSITGRSIIIHAVGDSAREAACVLGIEQQFDVPDPVTTPSPTTPVSEDPEDGGPGAASTATFSIMVIFACSMLALSV